VDQITTFKFALDLYPDLERVCPRYEGAARNAYKWGIALFKQQLDMLLRDPDDGRKTKELPMVTEPARESRSSYRARIESIIVERGVKPVDPSEQTLPKLWESDEELDAFLADIYAAREASVDK